MVRGFDGGVVEGLPVLGPEMRVGFAKVTDDQAMRVVRGFACAETIAEIAEATGLSAKTCRPILLALRPRLLRPPFQRWRDPLDRRWGLPPEVGDITEAVVLGIYAKCYFNRRCWSNFQQGRRSSRVCESCPIRIVSEPDDDLSADLYLIDLIHNHYSRLGIGTERGIGKLSLFRLRITHTQVVGEAFETTRKNKDGTPAFTDRRPGTVRMLYDMMIHDLEQEPLRREKPRPDPALADAEDLKWIESP